VRLESIIGGTREDRRRQSLSRWIACSKDELRQQGTRRQRQQRGQSRRSSRRRREEEVGGKEEKEDQREKKRQKEQKVTEADKKPRSTSKNTGTIQVYQ
jgi:hypothetical protein